MSPSLSTHLLDSRGLKSKIIMSLDGRQNLQKRNEQNGQNLLLKITKLSFDKKFKKL